MVVLGHRTCSLQIQLRRQADGGGADLVQGHSRWIMSLRAGLRPLRQIQTRCYCGIKLAIACADVRSEGGCGIVLTQLARTGRGYIPGIPRRREHMLATQHQASDAVIGKANLGIKAGGSTVAIECRHRRIVVQTVDPAIAEILEIGVKATNVNAGAFGELVVRATGEPPARAMVTILALVDRIEPARAARKVGCLVGDRFDVIDATAVPVISAAD